MSGAKERLIIRQVNTKPGAAQNSLEFSVMLNPARYSRTSAVSYTEQEKPSQGALEQQKFNQVTADRLDLDELVFDGTGIIDAPGSASDVDGQINLLTRVLNDPDDDENVLKAVVDIVWGTLVFRGRVASMKVDYTLFDACGTPLRARVKLGFVKYDKSGPMLSAMRAPQARQIRLVDGDSLPLLCFTAYDDPSLCMAVALFNGLTTIRQVLPGKQLTLPKLR